MSWLDAARQRLRDLISPVEGERELREEIAHHLELETERQVREGADPSHARWRALERLGDLDQIANAARAERGTPPLEGSMQDLQWAIRSLRKSAGFSALAICTLTLGIGATTVAFTVLDTVLLRPLPYHDPAQLVLIREVNKKLQLRPPSFPNFASWRESAHSFSAVVSAMYPSSRTVWPNSSSAEPLRVVAMGVSRRFFATLGVPPVVGREFTDDESRPGGPPAAMVSYEFWKSRMGGRQPLGTISDGGDPTPVVGVLPPGFQFVTPADVYFTNESQPSTIRSAHNYMVVGRLAPSASLASARTDMAALSRALLAQFGTETEAVNTDILPLRDYLVRDYRAMLTIVFGAAALVLLIACTNLVSAQLARGRAREREVVVRAALGASRWRLVRQLLLESTLLVTAGTLFAAIVAVSATFAIKATGVGILPRLGELTVDRRAFAFVSGVAVLTTLLVGVYPAMRLANGDASAVLRAGRDAATGVRASVWRLLVGFEIAMAVMLLIGASLLIRTLHNIVTADTGFDPHGIVAVSITPSERDSARFADIQPALSGLPGVEGVAFTTRMPLSWGNESGPVRRLSDPADRDYPAMAGFRVISPEYFSVLKQPLLRGRAFTANDRTGTPGVAIISPGIAESLWPGRDPVGKLIVTNYLFGKPLTVVGVAAEASSWTMPRGTQNEIYVPIAQHRHQAESQLIAMMRTRGDESALIQAARARLRQVLPNSAAQYETMDARIATSAADRRFAMLALTAFGTIALVLAAIGIYGVIWYIVTTRTHEIGIRMALGATAGIVRAEVLRGAAWMAAGGIVFGVAGGAVATKYLQSTLYGVSRLDPRTYALGAAVALVTALLAAYGPARQSSRVDPMTAIRS